MFNNCQKTRVDKQIDEMQESIAYVLEDIMKISKESIKLFNKTRLRAEDVAALGNNMQTIYEVTKNLASDLKSDARL
jgi:uncharacterized protein YoxC